jgi:CheY-like chemotaxis protein
MPGEDAALALGGELVLLVEDDAAVRRVVRQQLIDLGYPVIEAEMGNQAAGDDRADPDIAIVVSDVIMPGGDQRPSAGRANGAPITRMRIVLMSGYADEVESGRQRPAVLTKPFGRQDLVRALQRATREGKS